LKKETEKPASEVIGNMLVWLCTGLLTGFTGLIALITGMETPTAGKEVVKALTFIYAPLSIIASSLVLTVFAQKALEYITELIKNHK
jgi:hypothetical protein